MEWIVEHFPKILAREEKGTTTTTTTTYLINRNPHENSERLLRYPSFLVLIMILMRYIACERGVVARMCELRCLVRLTAVWRSRVWRLSLDLHSGASYIYVPNVLADTLKHIQTQTKMHTYSAEWLASLANSSSREPNWRCGAMVSPWTPAPIRDFSLSISLELSFALMSNFTILRG